MIILKILLIVLLADLAAGFFHFLLDQYGRPESRFFKNAIEINLGHHETPRKMIDRGYWLLTKDSWAVGAGIFGISLIWGVNWEVICFVIIGAQANIIHKWAHMKKSEKPLLVHHLQRLGILQNKHHHGHHHRKPFDSYFCVMTNFWNPILEKIYFWEGIMKIFKVFGLKPIAGTNIRNNV